MDQKLEGRKKQKEERNCVGRGEQAENSVVATQADCQEKKAFEQNKAQAQGWAEMLKG